MQAQLTLSTRPARTLTALTAAALACTSAIFGAMHAFVMGAGTMLVGVSRVLLMVRDARNVGGAVKDRR